MTASTEGPGTPSRPGDSDALTMSREAMEELVRLVSTRIMERMEGLSADQPWRGADREALEPLLREPPPEEGRDPREVVERVVRDVLPVAARVDHPRFFAFVPSSATWPGVMADFLAAGFNTFQGTWLGSGGPSQLELVVVDWVREWLGYPEGAGGLFTSGGSAASLDALVVAREEAGAPERPVVYMGDQSHSALIRAARIVGVRPERIRRVSSDGRFRVRVDDLARMIREDREAGLTPVAICANAGATNTGAVDPLEELADLAAREGIWLHVDAAYGGFAVLTGRGRALLRGIERADSVALDAHKWLFQPFEAGCLMVKDVRRLERTFSIRPEYLQDIELGDQHVNFADRGLQLTRSFRALKVWMSIQTFGMKAFRGAVARGMELADRAEEFIRAAPDLELLSEASLGVVCFRVNPAGKSLDEAALEALNESAQDRVIAGGKAMMSSTRLNGVYSLRLCILNHTTTWDDVRETLEAVIEAGASM
ncbi:MAG: aminotransferase class V-fold PLP-dependent enzyme [Gemmatimonadota bacterium]|nr:aminotransferase class V-fold PLP-dependent enzyme [Gemmatimonadota bacterium]MDH5760568.1 aminotransferase class V-fold PLP-dependent enzyme [Gemmatimonadota bacterium]